MARCEHCGAQVEHLSYQLGGVFFCDRHWSLYMPPWSKVAAGLLQAALKLGFSMVPDGLLRQDAIAEVYLPIPTIEWDRRVYTYKGEAALCIHAELSHRIHIEDNTHPHVDGRLLCEGEWWHKIDDAIAESRWQDVLLLAHMATCHYYPGGAYNPIEAIECHFCGRYATGVCDTCGHDVCKDHQHWLEYEDALGCPDCTEWCDECDTYVDSGNANTCGKCYRNICSRCSQTCVKCGAILCMECSYVCGGCGSTSCASCLSSCAECGEPYCCECLTQCGTCETMLCSSCMPDERCSRCISEGMDVEEEA